MIIIKKYNDKKKYDRLYLSEVDYLSESMDKFPNLK